MIAVLTADLIDSSSYSKEALETIVNNLLKEFDKISQETAGMAQFEFFRGDSFQGVLKDPTMALNTALRLKATVARTQLDLSKSKAMMPLGDVRIAIGVGAGTYSQDKMGTSNDQAFVISGRLLEGMKKQQRSIHFQGPSEAVNSEFLVTLAFLDNVVSRWSVASSEVVYYLLKGMTEQQIANELDRSQAAINLRKKAASWDEIQLLLVRYEKLIKELSHE